MNLSAMPDSNREGGEHDESEGRGRPGPARSQRGGGGDEWNGSERRRLKIKENHG